MRKSTTFLAVLFMAIMLMSGTIDLTELPNYANQPIPAYINKDNTTNNPITDEGATLGRVLFYDENLSVNNTISCGSCHKQEIAFGDDALASIGVDGLTGRHSMRLINSRFSDENRFFWDERANTLEDQTTQPIQDHIEMGFSGTNGDPDIDSLISKMSDIDYYNTLFELVYGDPVITEQRMQNALAQFVRSIQSFDSRFDEGRAMVNNPNAPFPNFTGSENAGKNLYRTPPQFNNNGQRIGGGVGCQACHRAPEFDIAPNSGNNAVLGSIGGGQDIDNTRSPSLRDIFNPDGTLNGPLMHNGVFTNINQVFNHYNVIPVQGGGPGPGGNNNNVDPRLTPGGNPQRLNLTAQERVDLEAFLRTLTGTNVYVDPRYSNPFEPDGVLNLIEFFVEPDVVLETDNIGLFINPISGQFTITGELNEYQIDILDTNGMVYQNINTAGNSTTIDLSTLPSGLFLIKIAHKTNSSVVLEKILNQ